MKDELKIKEKRIEELIHLLSLNQGNLLSREQKAKLQEESDRFEFRLQELLKECKLREVDFKIKSLEAKLEIIKNENT